MAKQMGPLFFTGRIGQMSFYKEGDEYRIRMVGGASRKKVLKHPRFEMTRLYAAMLADASRIASFVYRSLPKDFRQYWMFRAFTGEALTMLKNSGKTVEQVKTALW